MAINFAQDWPVYILLGAVLYFFIYVVIHSHKQEKINKEAQNKEKTSEKK